MTRVSGYLTFALLLGLSSFITHAQAETTYVSQDFDGSEPGRRVETTTYTTDSPEELAQLAETLKKSVDEAQRKNPDLAVNLERVNDPKNPPPSLLKQQPDEIDLAFKKIAPKAKVFDRALKESTTELFKKQFPEWFTKHNRYVIATTRCIMNGTVATVGFVISSHVPFLAAAAAGGITGVMSGGLSFWNKFFQTYLEKSLIKKTWPKAKIAIRAESFARWYLLEVGFVNVIELVLLLEGHPSNDDFAETEKSTLLTAALSVAAQGTFEVAIAKVTKKRLAEAAQFGFKRDIERIQMRSDLKALGVSSLSVTLAVSRILKLNSSWALFGAMTAGGIYYTYRVAKEPNLCSWLLGKPKPDPMGNPAGAQPVHSTYTYKD